MPRFTPPTRPVAMDHRFWGRYQMREGETIVRDGDSWRRLHGPTSDELATLTEGVSFFRGGYVYSVSAEVAQELVDAGFPVDMGAGFGDGEYDDEEYGD